MIVILREEPLFNGWELIIWVKFSQFLLVQLTEEKGWEEYIKETAPCDGMQHKKTCSFIDCIRLL